MSTILSRLAAFATPVIALSLVAAPTSYADPTPSGGSGTSWLAGQLTSGVVHNDQFDFDDYGLTVDFGLAFAATGHPGRRAPVGERRHGHARRRLHRAWVRDRHLRRRHGEGAAAGPGIRL